MACCRSRRAALPSDEWRWAHSPEHCVGLPQRQTLLRHGFEPSPLGVEMMRKAVNKHKVADVQKVREISCHPARECG
jgi:hypothetical protein